MKITETNRFRKSFQSLNAVDKQRVAKQFRLFLQNVFHRSLRTEKLEPKHKSIWSFRVDKSLRVIFTFLSRNEILVLDVGPHDIYKRLA